MADITALLAGAAKTNANFNFDELGKSYWGGLEEAYKRRTRDAFQDPSLYDAQGNIIPGKAISAALKAGGVGTAAEVNSLVNTGLLQQRHQNAERLREEENGDGGYAVKPAPSISQEGAPKQAAKDLTQSQPQQQTRITPPQAPGQPAKGPFDQFLTFQQVPAELRGQANAEIQKEIMLRTGRPFDIKGMNDPATREHVRGALATFATKWAASGQAPPASATATAGAAPTPSTPFEPTRMGANLPPPQPAPAGVPGMGPGGAAAAVPPPGVPQPPPVAAAPPQAAVPPQRVPIQQQQPPLPQRPVQTTSITPEGQIPAPLRGIVTPDDIRRHGSIEGIIQFYDRQLRYDLPKEQFDRITAKLAAIRSALAPTEDMKAAEARGMTLEQFAKEQERVKNEAGLTKDVDVPTLKEGLEKGKAANEEIKVYQSAKEVMNQPGGIIAGAGGDQLLAMAKVAGKYLGIPAAEQAATRTEAFRAIMSGGVLTTVKQLGAGSGITNADVKFASDMVGKNITLDENSIRRIIHLSEKVARRRIADHNANVDMIVKNNPALDSRADQFRINPPPLRITVSKTPQVGDVYKGREYYGGDPNKDASWSRDKVDGPDTLRKP